MRVVLVNWADIGAGALFGGGVNGYLQSLALELTSRGHEVISFTSGWSYLAPVESAEGDCRIRRLEDFRGVSRFEIINSPVVAPGIFQATDPAGEIEAPALERVFRDFIAMIAPDVVHFHNIEGFSAGCVKSLTEHSARKRPAIVFSLHNYHTICPQVYLMRGGHEPCMNFENGNACANCMPWRSRDHEIAIRTGRRPSQPLHGFGEVHDDSHRPLDNDAEVEGPVTDARSSHGLRRLAMIRMLSSCDRVLAVSSFVERKFRAMGVEPSRMTLMPIGTSLAASTPDASSPRTVEADGPINLVFMGYHNHYKGLHVLADSIMLLEPHVRARFALHVLAKDLGSMEGRLREMQDSLAGVFIRGEYRRDELRSLLSGMHVGVVPSVWWDNGPQTVMEFLSCGVPVLGANLGGIPDLVRHGENGWLFRGNDRRALAAQLTELAHRPEDITSAASRISPMISIAEHAAQLVDMYRGISASVLKMGD